MEINAFEMEGDFKPKARQALREIPGKRLDYDQQDATNSEVVSKTDLETSFSGEELGHKRVSRLLGSFRPQGVVLGTRTSYRFRPFMCHELEIACVALD
jgi:hypothetical protein